jgi:hypothetical protein
MFTKVERLLYALSCYTEAFVISLRTENAIVIKSYENYLFIQITHRQPRRTGVRLLALLCLKPWVQSQP